MICTLYVHDKEKKNNDVVIEANIICTNKTTSYGYSRMVTVMQGKTNV